MRETILQTASQLYLEQGEKGTSLRSIAKAVGVTPMALYRYFDNKEALDQALMKMAFQTFGDYLYRALRGTSAEERLYLSAEAYFDFAIEQSNYFQLAFMSMQSLNDLKTQELVQQESLPTFRFLMDRVRECMDSGFFKPGDVYVISIALLAQSTGLAALLLTQSMDWSADEAKAMARKSLDIIIEGLLAQPATQQT